MSINLADNYIAQYVIIRTWAAGVHFGILKQVDAQNRQVLITNCRRIWRWEGAFTLSELSQEGIKDGKLSISIPEILLSQFEEIIKCSDKAVLCLNSMVAYKP